MKIIIKAMAVALISYPVVLCIGPWAGMAVWLLLVTLLKDD